MRVTVIGFLVSSSLFANAVKVSLLGWIRSYNPEVFFASWLWKNLVSMKTLRA